MIKPDPKTGELAIPLSGTILSSRLTRSAFLSSIEGSQAKVHVKNEPWCSFRFEESEDLLVVIVQFKDENLESINLSINDPKFGNDWKDWSEQKELGRKQANNNWLASHGFFPGKKYSWGSVWSDYDARSGSSMIVIRYQGQKK
jgi:hypothetical protein